MKYGYARTSTDDQTTALQLAALRQAGCRPIHEDKGVSGALIGISRYALAEALPEELRASFPTMEKVKAGLGKDDAHATPEERDAD